jgi:diacylglycerol kinase (ATP)
MRVLVIINPAAGKDEPILNVLNDVFHPAGVDWDVRITHKFGDATRLAKEAAEMGVDLVAGYGGDGTQMEVVNGLFGSGVPQAILPGGTGNAMAHDLNIPLSLKEAVELIVTSPNRRPIDLGKIGDKVFMLRAYAGISQEDQATREDKNRRGQLAYIETGVKFLTRLPTTHFHVIVDGKTIDVDGIVCCILNAGAIGGVLGISLPTIGDVSVSDGYLDLYAITKGIQPLRAISHHIFHMGDTEAGVYHWSGKEITIEADPPQDVFIDGEYLGKTPFTTNVLPGVQEIVVPA